MKPFQRRAALLIFLLLATCLVFAFLVSGKFYISAVVAGGVVLIEVYYLMYWMERCDRLFRHFVWSVRHSDFLASAPLTASETGKMPEELTKAMEEADTGAHPRNHEFDDAHRLPRGAAKGETILR